jgi:hypothetical protein
VAATCAIVSVTDPVSALDETAVTATGTCTALNTVTVLITDSLGASVGPTAATVVGTGWTLAATNISALADGPIAYEATASDGSVTDTDTQPATKTTGAQNYITLAEFRAYIHDGSTLDTGPANNAILAASREVDAICGRYFYQDAGTSIRYFWPDNQGQVCIDDLSTATGLAVAVDSAGDGTWGETWTITTDFFLEPINQTQDGISGWPYTALAATFVNYYFPLHSRSYLRPSVRVTGRWGWAQVPDPVKQATFIIAAFNYWLGGVPSGAQTGDFGVVRPRENPVIQQLLGPYSKTAGVVVA